MNFLNLFVNFKSKHVINGSVSNIEEKKYKLTCQSVPSENINMRKKSK